MLAAREVTQESTGFSPNDLVFAHQVRGLLAVIHDQWTDAEPSTNLSGYVLGFRRLFSAWRVAREQLEGTQGKMKGLFDRRAERRTFSVGDQVLALLPVVGSPFQAKYVGPYKVLRLGPNDNYVISTRLMENFFFHVNLLKAYYHREQEASPPVKPVGLVHSSPPAHSSCPMVAASDKWSGPDDCVLQGRLNNSETGEVVVGVSEFVLRRAELN